MTVISIPEDVLQVLVADRAFDGERFVEGGVQVFVRGHEIVGLETGSAPPPDGSVLVRYQGCTVLPGLIDTHVHLGAGGEPDAIGLDAHRGPSEREAVIRQSLRRHLEAGVTAVRDLGDHGWAVADRPARPGEPLVAASGPPITTPGGHCASMGGQAAGEASLVRAVRERVDHRVQTVKIIVSGGAMTAGSDLLSLQYSPEELRLVVWEAHRQGLPVTAHAHSVPAVQACVQAGVDGIEHCTCITSFGIHTPPALLSDLAGADLVICPTFGRVPGSEPSPQALAVMHRTGMTLEARFAQVGELHAAGASIVAGSDAGIHPAKPHGVAPHSVTELVASGLSPTDALASATSVSARACGWGDVTGRLRPGLRADLLFVQGDPSRRIGDITQVQGVFLAGRSVVQESREDGPGGRVGPGPTRPRAPQR